MRLRRGYIAASIMGLAFFISPASAHTSLLGANLSAGSNIGELPSEISLTFAEQLISIGKSGKLSVLDKNGLEVTTGEVAVIGATLSKPLNNLGALGKYVVSYRVVASDGHVITGEYKFTVTPNAAMNSDNAQSLGPNEPTNIESKISTYLMISVTLLVGGALALIFIWKRQRI